MDMVERNAIVPKPLLLLFRPKAAPRKGSMGCGPPCLPKSPPSRGPSSSPIIPQSPQRSQTGRPSATTSLMGDGKVSKRGNKKMGSFCFCIIIIFFCCCFVSGPRNFYIQHIACNAMRIFSLFSCSFPQKSLG